jgi:hypothetical protein
MDIAELRPDETEKKNEIFLNFELEAERLNIAICAEDREMLSAAQGRIAGVAERYGIRTRFVLLDRCRDLISRPDLCTFSVIFISRGLWDEAMPEVQNALIEENHIHPTNRKFVLCLLKESTLEKDCLRAMRLAATRAVVKIPTKDGDRSVPVRDLVYFENVGRRAVARTLRGDVVTKLTMAQAKQLMLGYDFFVCPYVSFLVNLNYVKEISSRDVLLKNGTRLPLSEKRASGFRKIYRRFLASQDP